MPLKDDRTPLWLLILWDRWTGEPGDGDYSVGSKWDRRETLKAILAFTIFVAIAFYLSTLSGCGRHHYASSTDQKTDSGARQYWPRRIEGIGLCECWEDKTGVEHCKLIQ